MKRTIAGTCRSIGLLLLLAAVAACGVDGQEAPSLIGPSGFAQSVTLSASPDRLSRDGSSQSVVTITVRNESGQPVSGQRVTVGSSTGTLSQTEVTTGSDGRASVVVTAPPAGSLGNSIDVFATPVTANSADATTRTLQIALLGTSNTTAPAVAFTVTPTAPGVGEPVTFDASGTTDEGSACGTNCTFTWTFPNGVTRTGAIVTHTFTAAGSQTVSLSVRDAAGAVGTRQQIVTVSAVNAPTVALAVAPNPPQLNQQATFTATATPATGHSIVSYAWNFGDGTSRTTTASSTNKTYSSPGVYVVTVTATDDLGQAGSTSSSVSVASIPAPTVTLTASPNPPLAGQQATFTATATPATGHTITSYAWVFGDGTSQTTTTPSVVKTYTAQGTYVVTVTVTDDTGQTGRTSQQLNITSSAVSATISFSPTNPRAGQVVQFSALNPTAPNGATIADSGYEWNFGDPSSGSNNTATGRTVQHTFAAANTYVVRLTITDSNGIKGVFTTNVTVTTP